METIPRMSTRPPIDDDEDDELVMETVLVVDDEPMTVSALKHQLRRRYSVLGTTDAHEALRMLEKQEVAVVVSDQRMPGMQGNEFLEIVSRKWPDTARILITAYADLPALIRAVNFGQIAAYIAKPWDAGELDRVIDQAVANRALKRENARIQRDLQTTNEDLQRAIRKLREFTHAVAHDLQEPLRTISAYASILEEELGPEVDGEKRQFLSGVSRCSGHLRALIDDLLQFSELDRLPLKLAVIPLEQVVSEARTLLDGSAAARGGQVRVRGPLPTTRGDLGRLRVLFQNLFSNGLKFNTSAHPQIEVAAAEAPAGRVAVTVRDNGIGIAAEHQERIFQIFYRLHTKAEYPGTGAGLAIARQVVELHGGALSLTSEVGVGTTFRVELPAA